MKELQKDELMAVEGGQILDLLSYVLGFFDEDPSSITLKAGAINGYYRTLGGFSPGWSGGGW